jgi:hypothetical protein
LHRCPYTNQSKAPGSESELRAPNFKISKKDLEKVVHLSGTVRC